ncbi:MAG: alanine--tRNA ligase [Pseudomonadota bacterium]|nr:alanine--tRNA ligase [Pseudomonadota bacterium]
MKSTSSQIRKSFIDYFVKNNHEYVESSPLSPINDDTLLFTNAGMVQFKDIFLGNSSLKFSRAVSSQKCLRAGGKHNDLDNVGYTTRHHTFFEMLGNFSFGDYFKHEAINYAWDFLINELNISPDKLWVTIHKTDADARKIWLGDIDLDKNRLSVIDNDDNFWSMGDTGPCGPCTEIFYDFGEKYSGHPPGHGDNGERFVEIWNLVFMQYNKTKDKELLPLPKPSVDTGMGLERISAVMQGVHSNYEIDQFKEMLEFIDSHTKEKKNVSSMNVLADHIRSSSFLISENIFPANEGRGYVLRRIIRRALLHTKKLNLPDNFFSKLVPIFISTMGSQFPELENNSSKIKKSIDDESEKFNETLSHGLELLEKNIKDIENKGLEKVIPGDIVFQLYDTYGFPVDLTSSMASDNNFKIDLENFNDLMSEQKTRSKAHKKFDPAVVYNLKTKKNTEFLGYSESTVESKILEIIVDNKSVKSASDGDSIILVASDTSFYGESGGQVGDRGKITGKSGIFIVEDTQKKGDIHIHIGYIENGSFSVGDDVSCSIDKKYREDITYNHSATHLLHSALIKILGKEVEQKGSLVSNDKLRFDFSYSNKIKPDLIKEIENEVNINIDKDIDSKTSIMNKDEAIKAGAVALFGEKYSDNVRVLQFGNVSTELCGGTHVSKTGEIGSFKILNYESVAAGVKRIEAITGDYANKYNLIRKKMIEDLTKILKTSSDDLIEKVSSLVDENLKLNKEVLSLKSSIALNKILSSVENINLEKVNFSIVEIDYIGKKNIKSVIDNVIQSKENLVLVLCQSDSGKMEIHCSLSKNLLDKHSSLSIINAISDSIGATGGGKNEYAQCGMRYSEDFESLRKKISTIISSNI